jgi:hypothetical protein
MQQMLPILTNFRIYYGASSVCVGVLGFRFLQCIESLLLQVL